jgi:beta-phosphoglucomutase-like phosphatase (HAD superfamily)
MPLEAVIWDMDGVIADTAPFHFESWQQAARQRGVVFSEGDFKRGFGKRNPEIIRETFGGTLSAGDIARIAARKEKVFRDLAASKLKLCRHRGRCCGGPSSKERRHEVRCGDQHSSG